MVDGAATHPTGSSSSVLFAPCKGQRVLEVDRASPNRRSRHPRPGARRLWGGGVLDTPLDGKVPYVVDGDGAMDDIKAILLPAAPS